MRNVVIAGAIGFVAGVSVMLGFGLVLKKKLERDMAEFMEAYKDYLAEDDDFYDSPDYGYDEGEDGREAFSGANDYEDWEGAENAEDN
jgi:hypothetical protein